MWNMLLAFMSRMFETTCVNKFSELKSLTQLLRRSTATGKEIRQGATLEIQDSEFVIASCERCVCSMVCGFTRRTRENSVNQGLNKKIR